MGLPFPSAGKPATTLDLTEARHFWSFQPLKNVSLPKIKQGSWPRSPLDHFILARLEEKGMKPSLPADKPHLLRRVTYDLTGLPPTAEEVEAFLNDASADAFARVAGSTARVAAIRSEMYVGYWLDVARLWRHARWVGAGEDRRLPFCVHLSRLGDSGAQRRHAV